MRASLRWIQEFVDLPTDDPDEIAEALSNLGLEVESIEPVTIPFTGVKVARTLEIAPHPDADRIRLVTIDAGDETLQVVCGAWNFGEGDTVAYATVGSVLAGGLEVGAREIRGVLSPGMIASEAELGIGEDAGGILVLAEGEPGADFAAMLPYPDTIFDLSITPNRPDAMSILGVARDLAAFFDVPVRRPDPKPSITGAPTRARVEIREPQRCHRFTAREVRGVTVAPSPLWMRLRLRDAGVRPISNVVDVSNYVMLEYGQPLHAFDLDRVPEETIVVRLAEEGEHLRTLDEVDRTLTAEDLVISSPNEAVGLAGVIGGGDSEVSDDTTRVLIEVAHFQPGPVLLTGKRHAIRTEAVARFERGVDPELPPIASARAAELIVELAGGEVAGGFIDEYPTRWRAPVVQMPVGEPERLLGIPVAPAEGAGYLRRLGFDVVDGDDHLEVTVPSYRPDVTRPADLVEEIARIHGYNNISARLPFGESGLLPEWAARERRIRSLMAGYGFFEVWNYDFLGFAALRNLGLDDGDPRMDTVEVRNPLSEEEGHLRTTLLPGLLAGVALNQSRNRFDVSLFEMGSVYFPADGDIPDQPGRLAFVTAGRVPGPAWEESAERDASDAAGAVRALFGDLGIAIDLKQGPVPGFHPGRAARVLSGATEVGVVGEVHPLAAEAFDIAGRVAAAEIDLAALVPHHPDFHVPSVFPPIVFDLAFDLPGDAPAGRLLSAVRSSGGDHLERVRVFDVFSGPPLDEGRKSVALRLTFRHPERTMQDEELVPVRAAITTAVAKELEGRLRGG